MTDINDRPLPKTRAEFDEELRDFKADLQLQITQADLAASDVAELVDSYLERAKTFVKINRSRQIEQLELGEKPTSREICGAALMLLGKQNQYDKALEELGELASAICRFRANEREPHPYLNAERDLSRALIEELADVSIMVEQMAMLVDEEAFKSARNMKLERLAHRLKIDIPFGVDGKKDE